jgi:hypothetical protein
MRGKKNERRFCSQILGLARETAAPSLNHFFSSCSFPLRLCAELLSLKKPGYLPGLSWLLLNSDTDPASQSRKNIVVVVAVVVVVVVARIMRGV